MDRVKSQGFTLVELMITVAIIGILAAIAIPSYNNYTRKAYFAEVVSAADPFKAGISECMQVHSAIASCQTAGSNGVPAVPAASTAGVVNSVAISAGGVITVTPNAKKGIAATDVFVLTPQITGSTITGWQASGAGVTAGYAADYYAS